MGNPKAKEGPVGKVVMYGSVSVDGFVADENDQPGPLFDWLSSGDVRLDESGEVKDGKPPAGRPHGRRDAPAKACRPGPEAPFHFVDGVEAAVARARELAGDRIVEVAAGDVGGQVLAAGLVDEVRMDVVPVVFGSGKRYFGSVHAQHLLEDPDAAVQGNRVLHLRYRVRR
jgi:hypothetical protein